MASTVTWSRRILALLAMLIAGILYAVPASAAPVGGQVREALVLRDSAGNVSMLVSDGQGNWASANPSTDGFHCPITPEPTECEEPGPPPPPPPPPPPTTPPTNPPTTPPSDCVPREYTTNYYIYIDFGDGDYYILFDWEHIFDWCFSFQPQYGSAGAIVSYQANNIKRRTNGYGFEVRQTATEIPNVQYSNGSGLPTAAVRKTYLNGKFSVCFEGGGCLKDFYPVIDVEVESTGDIRNNSR